MYGLVSKAIYEMVCDRFGEDIWRAICQRAGIPVNAFLSLEACHDDLTYRLVQAASEVLNLSSVQIMQAFGEFGAQYAASKNCKEALESSISMPSEFLENLDELHTQVNLTFSQSYAFSPKREELGEDSPILHYRSTRREFALIVVSLMRGLDAGLNAEVAAVQTHGKEEERDHDTSLV